MFNHQECLRQLLRPEHYISESQYQRELECLFKPGWHPVALRSQLSKPGAFQTLDLLGTPLLIRNCAGELRAFLNVCPHRHSRLTDKLSGQSDRLRCQYHGWEFDKDGRTGKIPDAKAFRPWDRENSCLKSFRVGSWGDVVFVSLSNRGPSLKEFLAPAYELWGGGFASPFRFAGMWVEDFPCNWKVVLENSLESYHVPLIHPATFGDMPHEEDCSHELHPDYTLFTNTVKNDWGTRMINGLARRLGAPVTKKYHHLNVHPHITFTRLDIYRQVMSLLPSGPNSCRFQSIVFSLHGKSYRPLQWIQSRFVRSAVVHVAKKVFTEDGSVFGEIQKGMAASPFIGVIGTREERIYYFQEFVLRECGLELPPDAAQRFLLAQVSMRHAACRNQRSSPVIGDAT